MPTPNPNDYNDSAGYVGALIGDWIGNKIKDSIEESEANKNQQAAEEQQKAIDDLYFDEEGFLKIDEEAASAMMDEFVKVSKTRRVDPIIKENYIDYEHRMFNTMYNLTLGDCTFIIPPQAISIMSESTSQELVTLRQENTQKTKAGYSKRTINIELVFHSYNQINGYRVEGPEGYYYVDGLRQLLAQFKCTPFLPIENFTINNTYNIHTVALQSIICSTVEGFPDMLIANLTLQEVDLYPYLESHTRMFKYFIDWDLFRFYYQRQLTETHEYGKLQSIPVDKTLNKFKISILNQAVFQDDIDYDIDYQVKEEYVKNSKDEYNYKYTGKKLDFSFYDIVQDKKVLYTDENGKWHVTNPSEEHPSNFIVQLDSEEDNVIITSFQCGYSNMITNIQMAEHLHPTVQYMGGMDTMFNITLETTDEGVIHALEQCSIQNNMLIKNNRDCSSLGFIKIDSELTELFGSKFVVIDNVTTHTVPDFPDLFVCQINCISFDIYQKEREGIFGVNPFEATSNDINGTKGTEKNAITQSPKGLQEKIKQDLIVEDKIRRSTELYPDLKLPTYKEVDEVIKKIKRFRQTHYYKDGSLLEEYPIDKYPRTPQHMLRGITTISNLQVDVNGFVTNVADILENNIYEGYVDPDFYVFYPETIVKMMKETEEDRIEEKYLHYRKDPQSTVITTTIADIGNEVESMAYDEQTTTEGVKTLSEQFIAKAFNAVGKGYSMDYRHGQTSKDFPKGSYDCSGLVAQLLYELTVLTLEERNAMTTSEIGTLITKGKFRVKHAVNDPTKIDELIAHASPGDLLHVYNYEKGTDFGHIAIYIGDNKIIHAKGKAYGVCMESVPSAKYSKYRRVLEVPKLKEYVAPIKQQVTIPETKVAASSCEISTINGSDNLYITNSEIDSIARVVANIQMGNSTTSQRIQLALAQLIYDMFTSKKYGTINQVLANVIFNGASKELLSTNSSAHIMVKDVFCNGKKAYEKQLRFYMGPNSPFSDRTVCDKVYDEAGTIGDFIFWGEKFAKSLDKKYILVDDNNNVNSITEPVTEVIKTTSTGVTELTSDKIKRFGKPVIIKTSEMDEDGGIVSGILEGKGLQNQEERYRNNYNTNTQRLMSSFVNQCEFSGKGRLIKAFPTYLFSIVDEDGNWLNGKKLWANYYMLRSLVDIQVVSNNDSPVNTATITVTNSYGNLDTLPPNSFYYSPTMDNNGNLVTSTDDGYSKFQLLLYNQFGMLPGIGPKLTKTLIEQKNIIYDSMVVRAGCRMHLRMGYGSDPLGLPIVMNGYISDLQLGDIVQFVCVSDGVELVNSITSDSPKDSTNKESSNLCMDILSARQSWLAKVSKNWGEPNKFGIEHFGLYFSEKIEFFGGWSSNLAGVVQGSTIETTYTENGIPITKEVVVLGATIVDGVVNFVTTAGEVIVAGGKKLGDGLIKSWNEVQYDLNKNIYRAGTNWGLIGQEVYRGSLAMYNPAAPTFDGEKNMVFNKYNKTPWDAIQMAVMNAPEFLGMPMYHQFESRLFFGLPWYLAKYRYNMINGEIYEEAKAFAQCHFIDSLTEIIDNQMVTSSRDVYTNNIVMYTLGKTVKASPTIYSDKTVSNSLQSTKIFDSSIVQNWIGPDILWELGGFDVGKQAAIRVGVTQLLWNWQKAYQGDLMLLGDAGIEPDDYMYVNDRYNELTGLCVARTVTHTLSARTGFVTTVVPGMIALNTEAASNANVNLANMTSLCEAFAYRASVKKVIKDNVELLANYLNTFSWSLFLMTSIRNIDTLLLVGTAGKKLYQIFDKSEEIIGGIKAIKWADLGKEFKNLKYAVKSFSGIKKTISKTNSISKIGKSIVKHSISLGKRGFKSLKLLGAKAGGVAGAVGGPIGVAAAAIVGFVVGTIADILLTKIIDFLSYNNMVVLLPMRHKGIPYAPILSGEKLLLTGSSNVSPDTIADSQTVDEDEKTVYEE